MIDYEKLIDELIIDLENELGKIHQMWLEAPDTTAQLLNNQGMQTRKIIDLIKRKFKND